MDFSTGSVGLGAVAPNFAALVDEYNATHLYSQRRSPRRYISLLGDAELDEGAVWEAIAEPSMAEVKNVLWVVDLNRQSLDRIIPGIRVQAWRQMFEANGWRVIDAKYGKRLQAAYAEPNGEILRAAIDDMPNEVYQRLLRVPQTTVREWLPRTSRYPEELARFISRWSDEELQSLIRNLGGHDFAMLREALSQGCAGGGAARRLRLHPEGMDAPLGRGPSESLGHPQPRADGPAQGGARHRRGGHMGGLSFRQPGRQAVQGDGGAA